MKIIKRMVIIVLSKNDQNLSSNQNYFTGFRPKVAAKSDITVGGLESARLYSLDTRYDNWNFLSVHSLLSDKERLEARGCKITIKQLNMTLED